MWYQDTNNRGLDWEPQSSPRNLAQRHKDRHATDGSIVNPNSDGNDIGERIDKLAQKLPHFDHLIRALEQEYASAKTELILLKEEVANNPGNFKDNSLDLLKKSFEVKFKEVKQHTESLAEERNQLKHACEQYEEGIKQKEKQISKLVGDKQKLESENDSLKSRLSQVMENKLINNNPQIVDLSNKNRPSKLAERFSELYDNDWTDAYEVVSRDVHDERKVIGTLVEILMFIDDHCRKYWEEYASRVEREITFRKSLELPDFVDKQLKDCCKNMAPQLLDIVLKSLEDKSYTVRSGRIFRSKDCEGFIKGCVEICWLMAAQDPPVVLGTDFKPGDKIDSAMFRAYTKQGKTLDFLVWPPLFLHKDGPLLCKGVAQAKIEDSTDGADIASTRTVSSNSGSANKNDKRGGSKDRTRSDDEIEVVSDVQNDMGFGANNSTQSYAGALQDGQRQRNLEQTNKETRSRQSPKSSAQGGQVKEWKYRMPRENEWRFYQSYLRGYHTEQTMRAYLGEESFDLCRDYYNFLFSKGN